MKASPLLELDVSFCYVWWALISLSLLRGVLFGLTLWFRHYGGVYGFR